MMAEQALTLPSRLRAALQRASAAAISLYLAGCGASAPPPQPITNDEAEIALYSAIMDQDPRIIVTGGEGRLALDTLYDITCQKTPLDVWACTVTLDDDSRVSCTVDKVRRTSERAVDGRVHCKY